VGILSKKFFTFSSFSIDGSQLKAKSMLEILGFDNCGEQFTLKEWKRGRKSEKERKSVFNSLSFNSYDFVRTYALGEQNQLHQRLWIKITFYTVSRLLRLIFQFNCVSPICF